jgi:hypothetical protein
MVVDRERSVHAAPAATPISAEGSVTWKFIAAFGRWCTMIEWYDFYISAVLRHRHLAAVLPQGNDTLALIAYLSLASGSWCGRSERSSSAASRPGRPQARVLVTLLDHGRRTALIGFPATLRHIGIAAPSRLLADPAMLQGARARRRVRGAGLRRRARADQAAASTPASSRSPRRSGSSLARRHPSGAEHR